MNKTDLEELKAILIDSRPTRMETRIASNAALASNALLDRMIKVLDDRISKKTCPPEKKTTKTLPSKKVGRVRRKNKSS